MNCAVTTPNPLYDLDPLAVVSREPWPAQSIYHYRKIDDGDWGYLVVYADGRFQFDSFSSPSREEILARWSSYLDAEK